MTWQKKSAEEHTTTEYMKKERPVVKLEFPSGLMVKVKPSTILKYDDIENFYAVVTNLNKELSVHHPLPKDKTCVYIGVAGFRE